MVTFLPLLLDCCAEINLISYDIVVTFILAVNNIFLQSCNFLCSNVVENTDFVLQMVNMCYIVAKPMRQIIVSQFYFYDVPFDNSFQRLLLKIYSVTG